MAASMSAGSLVCPSFAAAPRAGRRVRPTAAAGVQLTSTFQGSCVSFMAGEQRLHVAAPRGQGRGSRSVVTCAAKVVAQIKLALTAGKANPAPPVGPALGSKGVNIMAFCKEYNAKTADKAGQIIPVAITVYDDKSFSLELKTPPASFLLKEKAGVKAGSAKGATKGATVGSVTKAQVAEIAKIKMADLNCNGDLDSAIKIISGSARNMGIVVKE